MAGLSAIIVVFGRKNPSTPITPNQLVQSSSENDIFQGLCESVNKTRVFFTLQLLK